MNVKEKKDPTEIVSESYSAAGRVQNSDFVADVMRSGDAKGAQVQTVSLRRTKGKQDELMSLAVEEVDSLIALLEHIRDTTIPKTNSYGIPVEVPEEKGKKK
jgi:CRISPR/Cas system-associated endoribonuclease Cas2